MKYHLQRYLFLLVLLSLSFNGHDSFVNTSSTGIWEANDLARLSLAWEEANETESEDRISIISESFKLEKGGDGDGGIVAKPASHRPPAPSLFTSPSAFSSTMLRLAAAQNAAKAEANSLQLYSKPKARLFLLFHNIKSDPAHPAA